MSVLSPMPEVADRPLFPGELELTLMPTSHDGGKTWWPGDFLIQLQDFEQGRKLQVVKGYVRSGQWKLLRSKQNAVALHLESLSMTGGMTQAYFASQYPGLVNLLGDDVANGLRPRLLDMLKSYHSQRHNTVLELRSRGRFTNPIDYVEMVLNLEETYLYQGKKRFDRNKVIKGLAKVWTDPEYGPEAQLKYLMELRPAEPGPEQVAHDESTEAFRQLVTDSKPVYQELLKAT